MEGKNREKQTETCWIIDLFPERVSPEFNDRFSAAESYFLGAEKDFVIRKKLHFLIRLNCYMRFQVYPDEEETPIPDPDPSLLKDLLEHHSVMA